MFIADLHNDVLQRAMIGEDISIKTNHGHSDLVRLRDSCINLEVFVVWINNQHDKEGKLLFASQDGKIQDLTSKNLILNYLKHPLMTFIVIVAIHYEAFKLWFKKVKLVKKK